MNASKNSTRRAFFLQGGAALGAGVATTAGAAAARPDEASSPQEQLKQLQQQLGCAADRDAIRHLQLTFAALIEKRSYAAAAELFDERAQLHLSGLSASGKAAILRLFEDQYGRQRASVLHSSYRQSPLHRSDAVTLSEDRQRASATFHVEVELCTPLADDCTAAKMARLQGQVADRRWETGRLEGQYVKQQGRWKVSSLIYKV